MKCRICKIIPLWKNCKVKTEKMDGKPQIWVKKPCHKIKQDEDIKCPKCLAFLSKSMDEDNRWYCLKCKMSWCVDSVTFR